MNAAYEIISQIQAFGVRPDEVTYNILIDALGKRGDLDRAWGLFSEMQPLGNKRTVSVSHAWDRKLTRNSVHHYAFLGLVPTKITFNAIASACAKAKNPAKGLVLLTHIAAGNVELDYVTFWALAEAASGQSQEALELQARLRHVNMSKSSIPVRN